MPISQSKCPFCVCVSLQLCQQCGPPQMSTACKMTLQCLRATERLVSTVSELAEPRRWYEHCLESTLAATQIITQITPTFHVHSTKAPPKHYVRSVHKIKTCDLSQFYCVCWKSCRRCDAGCQPTWSFSSCSTDLLYFLYASYFSTNSLVLMQTLLKDRLTISLFW